MFRQCSLKVQTKMFEVLGTENPRQRSLYLLLDVVGHHADVFHLPKNFLLSEVKAQVIAEF
jgi:hypothetical protein